MYGAIVNSLDPLGMIYEIRSMDDGIRDGTFTKAKQLAERDPLLRVIQFRKNYGQTPAMVAGIHHARGKVLTFSTKPMYLFAIGGLYRWRWGD